MAGVFALVVDRGAAASVLPDRRLRVRLCRGLAVDPARHAGRLLHHVSLRALGRAGVRPAPLDEARAHCRRYSTCPPFRRSSSCRQLPISGLITNLLLGLAPIRHLDFLVGTAIGLLPEAIPFTLVASGAVKLGGGEHIGYVLRPPWPSDRWCGSACGMRPGIRRYFASLRRGSATWKTE